MFHSYPSDTMGNRLRAARLIREMTQGDLSMALEISRAAISQWEAGITTPGIDTLARAAALLKVSPEWLAWGRVAPDFSVAPGSMRHRARAIAARCKHPGSGRGAIAQAVSFPREGRTAKSHMTTFMQACSAHRLT